MNKLISVILPVFNAEKYLEKCMDSLINQTFEDIEIICINDGSTDNSLEILNEYSTKDERIKIINQENAGSGEARNAGMNVATGEFITFIGGDDWVDNDYLEKLYNRITETEADIVRCTYKLCYADCEKNSSLNELFHTKYKNNETISPNDHNAVVWGALYKTSLLKDNNILFDKTTVEDILFSTKVSFLSKKSVSISDTYYYYRKTSENPRSKIELQKALDIVKANSECIDFLNSIEVGKDEYIAEFKRCLWRCDFIFKQVLKIENFSEELKKEFVKIFYDNVQKFKYKKSPQKLETSICVLQKFGKSAYLAFFNSRFKKFILKWLYKISTFLKV